MCRVDCSHVPGGLQGCGVRRGDWGSEVAHRATTIRGDSGHCGGTQSMFAWWTAGGHLEEQGGRERDDMEAQDEERPPDYGREPEVIRPLPLVVVHNCCMGYKSPG